MASCGCVDRESLDTVVAALWDGATAEEIVQQYPSISLADVYHVIGYALRHATEVETYLATRGEAARAARELNEATWPPDGIRSVCSRAVGRNALAR